MTLLQRNLLLVSAVFVAALVLFICQYLLFKADPSASVMNVENALSCRPPETLNVSYAVETQVQTILNGQRLHQQSVNFQLHLQEATPSRVFGAATAIRVRESLGEAASGDLQTVADLYFLTHAETGNYLALTQFDNLGLMAKHPMAVLSQVLKNLSLGNRKQAYIYAYDPMKNSYHYRVDTSQISRVVTNPTLAALTGQNVGGSWTMQLDDHCLPLMMQASERLPIGSSASPGSLEYVTTATRIDGSIDLLRIPFAANMNANNHWQVVEVDAQVMVREVSSESDMWQAITGFADTRDSARLAQSAKYMIEHLSADKFAEAIASEALSDGVMRDAIFGLGMVADERAEGYMLGVLQVLPVAANAKIDLQKVRLMAALAGKRDLSPHAYEILADRMLDPLESANIKRNALINMGSVVKQIEGNGADSQALRQSLSRTLIVELGQTKESSAAIFSAGNVGLDNLPASIAQSVGQKLRDGTTKERYASARVLGANPGHTGDLITQLAVERSPLVVSAIVGSLGNAALTPQQLGQLQSIAATSIDGQVRRELEALLLKYTGPADQS